MSKIDTLINIINYQKQNPEANQKQAARAIGITPQYLGQCLGEINLLREHLTPSLGVDQIRFLLSELDQNDLYKREIYRQLQEHLNPSPYTGIIRMASPNEHPPADGISIGEFVRSNNGASDSLPSTLQFSLDRLCYDSLFWVHRSGEIEPRLATTVEPEDDFSAWTITLRADLRWSDGKPIRQKDVIETISESHLTKLIDEIKPAGKNRLRIQLTKAESMFPQQLASLPIRPSHSLHPYRVTSGAYRLKKSFSPKAINFRLTRNPNHYQEKRGGIDWITIRRFKHAARAVEAVLNEKIDFIRLDALQPLYQASNDLPLQQAPFFGEAYYLMFLNRREGLLKNEPNCRQLNEAINYRGINRYLHGGQHFEERALKSSCQTSLNLRITYPKEVSMVPFLATLVGKSVGDPIITATFLEGDAPQKMREDADALLSQIFLGVHHSRLSRYFHPQGRNNAFGYTNPEVEALLSQLDETTDVARRRGIGQQIMSLLQEDYAIILLSPHFQYFLSPLEIQFDTILTNHTDFIENMKYLVVERG